MSVEDDHKLFVAGLADLATEEGLRNLFESAGGSVSEVTVPRDRATGKARGFAFVTMGSEEDARAARQRLDGSNFEGRPLSVRPFRADRGAPGAPVRSESRSSEHRAYESGSRPQAPRGGGFGPSGGGGFGSGQFAGAGSGTGGSGSGTGSSGSGRAGFGATGTSGSGFSATGTSGAGFAAAGGAEDSTLYIGNLPFDCTSAELEQMFSERGFASVRRVHLPLDPEGRPRGFGFVSLDSADAARRAVEQLHDANVRGRRLSISVARARGAPGTGGSGGYQRVAGAPAPGRPPRPTGSSGAFAAPAHNPAPRYEAPAFPAPAAPFPGSPAEENRRQGKWDKEKDKDKKKEKKKKGKSAPTADRGLKKRRDDGFRSTRAQDYVDDWDDD